MAISKTKNTTKRKSTSSRKKGRSNSKTPHSAFGHFGKKISHVMLNVALIVLFALIIVVGAVSYYVIYAGLSPVEANMEEKYNYMYSEYPFLHRWVDSLNRHKALRDTVIYAPDSTKLHAYFIQAPKHTVNTAVIVHGHRCCAVDMFHIAYMYNHDMKFNVLLPDLRAHGDSEGTHEQMGWLDRLDVLQWMEVANERFGGATKMVVHGISMGAATTMMVSGEANQPEYVKCYVEDCGYTDVWDEFSYVAKHDYHIPAFPFINIASHICKWKYGWDFKEASAINQVKKCTKPMLFIHGMSDTYVPTEMVYRLYSAKAKDKSIWTKRGVMHARMYHDYPKEYTHEVSQFVNMWFYKK